MSYTHLYLMYYRTKEGAADLCNKANVSNYIIF